MIEQLEEIDERYEFSLTLSYNLPYCPFEAQEIDNDILDNWPYRDYLVL